MKKYKKQKGAVMIMTAILMPIILAFTGIAVDIGRLYVEKAKLQNLADAAATAALVELKKTEHYVNGSGSLTPNIPIGALTDNSRPEIMESANIGARPYFINNSDDSNLRIGGSGVTTTIYALKNSDSGTVDFTYYYEVIVAKEYPVFFAAFIHPEDVLVRAGAVCKIDVKEPVEVIDYAYALKNWSNLSKTELYAINSAKRLEVDIEALTNLANFFVSNDDRIRDTDFLDDQLGVKSGSGLLLGHYEEHVDGTGLVTATYTPNNSTAGNTAGDKVIHWMQGDYDYTSDIHSGTQEYPERLFFSDYATSHKDGIKISFKTEKDNVSGKTIVNEVTVQINPGDAATGGSGPLCVIAKYSPTTSQ